jgi:prophage maintenance system killer protein
LGGALPEGAEAVEKDKGLASALGAVMQTFGGQDLYPSLEEKAAHLLYFLVTNHAFVDGNKRIAAALLLWFLQRNRALHKSDGEPVISNETLVAVTLLIAESRPEERKFSLVLADVEEDQVQVIAEWLEVLGPLR